MKEWCVPLSKEKLQQEENQLQEENLDEVNKEEYSLEDLDSTERHTPSIPTDPESKLEGGGHQEEQVHPSRKKKNMKVDQTANTVSLDSDDMQLMTYAITKAAQSSFKSIGE